MVDESPSTAKQFATRAKRVSAQHTLERVRNNQRRHRARQKDHVATLEEKLTEAECTISALKKQVDALQAELINCQLQIEKSCRSPSLPRQHEDQHVEELQELVNLDMQEVHAPLPALSPFVNELGPSAETTLDAVTIFKPISTSASSSQEPQMLLRAAPLAQLPFKAQKEEYPFLSLSQKESEPALLEMHHANGPETLVPIPLIDTKADVLDLGTYSFFQSTRPDFPTSSRAHNQALLPNLENYTPPEGHPDAWGEESTLKVVDQGEATILCSEAYILISQQNLKGVSPRDVDTWLCNGFRWATQPGEGCRVKTDLLLSLIDYISDIWSVEPSGLNLVGI